MSATPDLMQLLQRARGRRPVANLAPIPRAQPQPAAVVDAALAGDRRMLPRVRRTREDESCRDVAAALGVHIQDVFWMDVEGTGRCVVVRTPWTRVAVARTASGAKWAATELRAGRCDFLLQAIGQLYPDQRTGWQTAPGMAGIELPAPDLAFVKATIPRRGFTLLPGYPIGAHVEGRWIQGARGRILLARYLDGGWTFQLRATAHDVDGDDAAKEK